MVDQEIICQCNRLDGVEDGVTMEPDAYEFCPKELLCGHGKQHTGKCLSKTQVEMLKDMY